MGGAGPDEGGTSEQIVKPLTSQDNRGIHDLYSTMAHDQAKESPQESAI
jgi:hypothetical protein